MNIGDYYNICTLTAGEQEEDEEKKEKEEEEVEEEEEKEEEEHILTSMFQIRTIETI